MYVLVQMRTTLLALGFLLCVSVLLEERELLTYIVAGKSDRNENPDLLSGSTTPQLVGSCIHSLCPLERLPKCGSFDACC